MAGALAACSTLNQSQKEAAFARATAFYDAGDYQAARKIWQKLGDDYDLAALQNLGHIYRRGLGVEVDLDRAMNYYHQAAQYGFAPAQYNLAMMYFKAAKPKARHILDRTSGQKRLCPCQRFFGHTNRITTKLGKSGNSLYKCNDTEYKTNEEIVMTNLMQGKRGLIMGVANQRSIAWGIAQALAEAGAELAFTYQGEALERRIMPLAQSVGSKLIMPCDVTDTASLDSVFNTLKDEWGKLDFVVHAIAFADKDELAGRYVDTSANNFQMSLNISCYSFTAVANRAEKLMPDGGALLTLSYYGAEKTIPHYNVMGVAKAALEASVRYLAADLGPQNIRVNSISAGPIKHWLRLALRGCA
uniref:SEL-1-like domain containing protein n=1 Tax=uncultured organism TaxID=155900 RepID=A0A1B3SNY8_9ZZZZ|nr:SEL-1-like domain containing protein [uncultured organism]